MNPDTKTIALIDDDDGPTLYYYQAIKDADFQVDRLTTFKAALDYIQNPMSDPDMWIVDVMMPIGDESLIVDGEDAMQSTSLGLGAGLLLYKLIKKRYPLIPVTLLTSITTPKLLDAIEQSLRDQDTCEAKLEILPTYLVQIIKNRTKPNV